MNEPEQAAKISREPKVIKRYTNRKLYDTVESRYVTLDEIAEMIKQGTEVKIIDNRNKEDLTSVTLAQIIFEEEKKKSQMPLALLREIIRHPGETIAGFIQNQVTPRVASLREEAETRFDTTLADWQRKIDERVKLVVENVIGNLPALGRDMQALQDRLIALEKKLEEAERKP